jgi:CHASE2 domain-containing sensor protein
MFRHHTVFRESIMNWRSKLRAFWRSAVAGAILCALLGLGLLQWGHELVFLSYDLVFMLFRNPASPEEVAIVYMDDRSFNELKQTTATAWDRNEHARLLDRLTADRARLVVFDIVFDLPGDPAANTNFANAMRRNGKVVLATAVDPVSRPQIYVKSSILPLPEFIDAAAGTGITEVMSPEKKTTVRQYFADSEARSSLPWVAASMSQAKITESPELWLNYYGPPKALRHFSYCDINDLPPRTFQNKAVFIGVLPKLLNAREEADAFRTPYTLWTGQFMPGVEIAATAYLNLLRNDGFTLWSWPKQIALVLIAGVIFGAALGLLRPLGASAGAAIGVVCLLVAALQAAKQHVWFPWTIVAFVQIPVALGWSLRCHFHRLKFEKDVLERTLVETTRFADASARIDRTPQPGGLAIPDHTLLRRVGKGAYGEVWLARNAIGVFHAVKIVRRREFPSDIPYEREFKGIQKFMPISRSHPGLVHILHVGRNDPEGFSFYIMEVCDDASSGQRIDPENYAARTLAAELESRGRLSLDESLRVGLALGLALEHLHQQQLIHRDIKPGNIIYVNAAPKFADIGLVTDIGANGREVSCLGTEGYMAPEGPGTAGADIYALGKVLYEAAMGRDRRLFPEVPTAILEQPGDALARLNQIICKACETNPVDRYQSAMELHADLLTLQQFVSQHAPSQR